MRHISAQYKTHRQNQSTRDSSIHGLDSRQNKLTICLSLGPQPRSLSQKSYTKKTNKKIGDKHTSTDPSQEKNNGKTELIMDTVGKTHEIYTDQTEKFLLRPVEATSMY